MIIGWDSNKGRVSFSTKKLELTPGDMIRDRQLVFENAEETAAKFRSDAAQTQLSSDNAAAKV